MQAKVETHLRHSLPRILLRRIKVYTRRNMAQQQRHQSHSRGIS